MKGRKASVLNSSSRKVPSKRAAARRQKPAKTAGAATPKSHSAPLRRPAAASSRKKQARKPKLARKTKPAVRVSSFSRALKGDISTVLVTGATGSVGVFLVRQLLREGYEVVAVDRKILGQTNPFIEVKKGLLLKSGDLTNRAFVSSCLGRVDAVFHLPVYTESRKALPDVSFPVQGTLNLCEEARRNGVRRFVHVGSGMIYKRSLGSVDESAPLEARNEYEQSQILAERIALNDAPPGLPVVTVLRTAPIYGPRCMDQMAAVATLPPLVKALGPYYLRLSGGSRMNLAHAEDVARAAIFLLLHPKAHGQVFNIADNDPRAFGDFVNQAMEAYGLRPLRPRVPYPPSTLLQSILPHAGTEEIFNPLSHLSSLLWDRMARKHKLIRALSPRIDPETVSFGAHDLLLDNRKLLGLGFRLKYPAFVKGWKETLDWYVAERWLPRPQSL